MNCPTFSELDEGSIAAEVVMLRGAMLGTILIVEGGSDERFFRRFIEEASCEVVIAHGRENALGAMGAVKARNLVGVICVVDADHELALGLSVADVDIIVTDERDLETTIIRSPALDRLLLEMGSRAKLMRIQQERGGIKNALLECAYPLGALRLYSAVAQEHLKFKGISYQFVGASDLQLNVSDLLQIVYNHSRRVGADMVAARSYIETWANAGDDRWKICCGHDLVAILSIALRRFAGSQSATAVEQGELESRLRLAYDADDLRATQMFKDIRAWEARTGYRCFDASL